MDIIECSLAPALIIFAFFIKLTIDRKVELLDFFKAVIELPQDIVLQGSIFIIAFILIPDNNSSLQLGILYFIGYLFALAISVFFSRRSLRALDKGSNFFPFIVTLIAFFIAIYLLYYAITLITEVRING